MYLHLLQITILTIEKKNMAETFPTGGGDQGILSTGEDALVVQGDHKQRHAGPVGWVPKSLWAGSQSLFGSNPFFG